MLKIPDPSCYSFNSVQGILYHPTLDWKYWAPFNPDYDPGPPPPPRVPKEAANNHGDTEHISGSGSLSVAAAGTTAGTAPGLSLAAVPAPAGTLHVVPRSAQGRPRGGHTQALDSRYKQNRGNAAVNPATPNNVNLPSGPGPSTSAYRGHRTDNGSRPAHSNQEGTSNTGHARPFRKPGGEHQQKQSAVVGQAEATAGPAGQDETKPKRRRRPPRNRKPKTAPSEQAAHTSTPS
jgi:hypothetical protein